MQTPASSEHFQRTGIDRYPVLTPFVPQGKKPFKSKVRMPSLCVHNQWYKLPFEPDIGKSVPAVGAAPHYICMSNLKLRRVTSKNWNDASSEGGEYAHLNLMQGIFALDHELAMAGKSITGAV
ncbi:hypothetical protein [Pseudomonas lini]|uniref:Uncharacterized protein n=1 Tax=Pseudomonas lini TaxID=163011 RepID=A0A0J6H8Z1_9PSED|nr:hypothetical protein [Pseudomonas lini]KAB0498283.1 hypothetical protein F7R14_27500 [Pseudomonas lini]KMM93486.1 hypothetical protein TU81_11935 [Pseudomonas lini]SDT55451.1 hypothetical protein SAMN04490191_5151 [Pseudomonas lini]